VVAKGSVVADLAAGEVAGGAVAVGAVVEEGLAAAEGWEVAETAAAASAVGSVVADSAVGSVMADLVVADSARPTYF
jgi:hypothetical protein